tara:strand:+ start:4828 stop:5157 length:330 start_codon:yes stop_codon:yes gene_type:complete
MNSNNKKVKNLLQEIEENKHKKVLVYSLEGCPACDDLKGKFDKIGLTYENVEMSGNEEMWTKIEEWGGSEYVPQVKVESSLIKEDEYETITDLIGKTLSKLLDRKIIIK